jgi:glycosyltransferase involved in cell wall biosynthesis
MSPHDRVLVEPLSLDTTEVAQWPVRPRIAQHCFGPPGSGGPIVALGRLMNTALATRFEMHTCIQEAPAGGVSLRLCQSMARTLRQIQPDLVHVRGLGNEGFHGVIAAKLARVPKILVSVHGSHQSLQEPRSPWRAKVVGSLLEPATLRLADGVVTVCESMARTHLIRRHARRFLGVVHNGVDWRESTTMPPRRSKHQSQRVNILYLGRLSAEKGVHDLVDAILRLDALPLANLLALSLVGDGPDALSVQKRLDGCRRISVTYHGHQPDVSYALASADILVVPSWHENLPNSLLEAMAASVPVIATAVGGIPEVVEDGRSGLLVPPRSSDALAAAISTLATDQVLRDRLAAEGVQVIAKRFSLQLVAERYHRVYCELLGLEATRAE